MKTLSLTRITIAALAVMFSLILFSCQKENSFSNTSDSTVTEEEATNLSDESTQADASFDDVEDVSMIAGEEEGEASVYGRLESTAQRFAPAFEELKLRIGLCATISVLPNDNTYPKKITIDFGDGCLGADGKYRKGVILIYLTGPIRRSGSVMTILLQNFYLNRAHIEGTKTFTNLSENGNIKFTVQVTGGKVTFPNGRGYSNRLVKAL